MTIRATSAILHNLKSAAFRTDKDKNDQCHANRSSRRPSCRLGTPHVKEWHRKRHENRVEGERHLATRNWSEAERHLTLALAERRHSSKRRLDLLLGLTEAQRKQGKSADAEKTSQMAIDLAASAKNKALQSRALDGLVDIQLDQKKYSDVEATIAKIETLERSLPQPDYKRLASSARKLGTALLNSGRPEEAHEGV